MRPSISFSVKSFRVTIIVLLVGGYTFCGYVIYNSERNAPATTALKNSTVKFSYEPAATSFHGLELDLKESRPLLTSAIHKRQLHYRDINLLIEHHDSIDQFPLGDATENFQTFIYQIRYEDSQRQALEEYKDIFEQHDESTLVNYLNNYQRDITKYNTLKLSVPEFSIRHQQRHDYLRLERFFYPVFIKAVGEYCKAPMRDNSVQNMEEAVNILQLGISNYRNRFENYANTIQDWDSEIANAEHAIANSKLLIKTEFPDNVTFLDNIIRLMPESMPAIQELFHRNLNSYLPKQLMESNSILAWGTSNDAGTTRLVSTIDIRLHDNGGFLPAKFIDYFKSDLDYDASQIKRLTINGKTYSNKLTATPFNIAVRNYNTARQQVGLDLKQFEILAAVLDEHKTLLQPEYDKTKQLLPFLRKTEYLLKLSNES